jgi:hypothetical protein
LSVDTKPRSPTAAAARSGHRQGIVYQPVYQTARRAAEAEVLSRIA